MDETLTTKTTSPVIALGGVHTTVMLSLSTEELWVIALAVPCETDFIHSPLESLLHQYCIRWKDWKPDKQQGPHMWQGVPDNPDARRRCSTREPAQSSRGRGLRAPGQCDNRTHIDSLVIITWAMHIEHIQKTISHLCHYHEPTERSSSLCSPQENWQKE